MLAERGPGLFPDLDVGDSAARDLSSASLVSSEDGRHEYAFDAVQVPIATLLTQAGEQAPILDIETHHAPIDEVVADIYEQWLRRPGSERSHGRKRLLAGRGPALRSPDGRL
ncbi:MAG: hypothetical protein ABW318_15360 [Vicinamibacterales bacterium]|jgi:hypothetical protein